MSQAFIDFHCHHVPARFNLTAVRAAPPSQKARWEGIAKKLADEDALLRDIRDGILVLASSTSRLNSSQTPMAGCPMTP
jgi:hypothetical protein